ncbi:MAG: hypothetical protein WD572_04640 [Gammaproteobacteria bacterium]
MPLVLMPLAQMQTELQSFYDLQLDHDVADFLITDPALAQILGGACVHQPDERLLVQQDAEDLHVSLYLDADLMERLQAGDHWHTAKLADLTLALEGISHFVYLTWNAGNDRCVSLLELELQAEIDKFVLLLDIMQQRGGLEFAELHRQLFSAVRYADTLNNEERQRYTMANDYAARYCWMMLQRYATGTDRNRWYNELRNFYRLPQADKFRRIRTLN